MLKQAFQASGARFTDVVAFLPEDLTIWCDPGNVSVRLGAEGSIWSLKYEKGAQCSLLCSWTALRCANKPNEAIPHCPLLRVHLQAVCASEGKGRWRSVRVKAGSDADHYFIGCETHTLSPPPPAPASAPRAPLQPGEQEEQLPGISPMAITPQKPTYSRVEQMPCSPQEWRQMYGNVNVYTNPPPSSPCFNRMVPAC